jgi:dTDP-4-dehydrorhamnose 3,5-epimerase
LARANRVRQDESRIIEDRERVMEALSIDGAWLHVPRIFADSRGSLSEWFQGAGFAADLGYRLDLGQVNWSVTRRGAIRGLHVAQVPPGQAKYVACVSGAVLDVAVDLRVGSPTFGRWEGVRLDEDNQRALFIEHGLGHAFTALTPSATVLYMCSSPWDSATDRTVHPLDPALGIDWPADAPPILSDRDAAAPTLAEAERAGLLPSYRVCAEHSDRLRARAAVDAGLDAGTR